VSTEYINAREPLDWKCEYGHMWRMASNKVQQGRWCPVCKSHYGEKLCRNALERITGLKFPKARPKWLKSKNGGQLELDGYNERACVAFEYQGRQHYFFNEDWHQNRAGFRESLERDRRKKDLCAHYGVTLIVVPFKIAPTRLASFIQQRYQSTSNNLGCVTRLQDVYTTWMRTQLKLLQDLANSRGGSLMSNSYKDVSTKLNWMCAKKHQWYADAAHVKRGSWCPICGGKTRLSLSDLHVLATERGGICLATAYKNCREKLPWRCQKGHNWYASQENIKQGKWCPECWAKRRHGSRESKK